MLDERKKNVRVVVGGESSRCVDGSGAAPDVGVPLDKQFPLDLPIVREAVVSEDARRQREDEDAEADDESEFISVSGPPWSVGGCETEGVTFEEAVERAGLIPETETALDTAGLRICYFSHFSITSNFLLGFHTGQLFHPLS